MDSWLRQTVTRTALGLAEYVIPVLRHSKFKETGLITPEEFTVAGDFLVHQCPTWQWAVGDKPPKSYLPSDKQYLITRNVPCYKRIRELDNYDAGYEKVVDGDDFDDGWVDTHHFAPIDEIEKPIDVTPSGDFHRPPTGGGTNDDNDDDGEDEEAVDMEEFMQSGMLDEVDTAALVTNTANLNINADVDGILHTRTYDLYITYDKYYQTPRMWFYGYDENRKPLKEDQMYEDISQDHAKKTVTMEYHPHLSGPPVPSIHPCRQAEVMLKLLGAMADEGVELEVHQYMMIFLKFVQAVIPTIDYDYTRQFNLS